jgi:hypothetical protein
MKSVRLIKMCLKPVPMADRSEACTVFGRSNTGIVGSNPTRGMDVCPRFSVCRQRPYVGPIPRPRSPTNCPLNS